MQKVEILKSVGNSGKNKAIDVSLIQALIRDYFSCLNSDTKTTDLTAQEIGYSNIIVNGTSSPLLVEAIKMFQIRALGMKTPDGRVDVNGASFKKLVEVQEVKPINLFKTVFGELSIHTGMLSTIPSARFKGFFKQYHGLTVSKGEDFTGFFDMLRKDAEMTDIRWAAYVLATTYHETTFSFKPKSEDGKGAGYKYSKVYEVVDSKGVRGKVGEKYKNIYYGRGYVQITWDYNYKSLGKVLGIGDKLYVNPDLALDKDIAYKITSYGMREGSFTQKKLSDYINFGKTDYLNARRIINGVDHAHKIASYAESIEFLLRLAARSVNAK